MGSFRDYRDDLERQGELKVVKEEVSPDIQASAICGMSQRVGGPAIQFDNVKGYPGKSLIGSVFCGPGFFGIPSGSSQDARKDSCGFRVGSLDYLSRAPGDFDGEAESTH